MTEIKIDPTNDEKMYNQEHHDFIFMLLQTAERCKTLEEFIEVLKKLLNEQK